MPRRAILPGLAALLLCAAAAGTAAAAEGSGVLGWLAAPLDPRRVHDVPAHIAWHGRLMVFAWAILLPVGALAARFLKVLPWQDWPRQLDNKTWWHLHRSTQYAGAALTLVAVALVLPTGSFGPTATLHHLVGWTVLALLAVQISSAWLRGTKGGPTAPAPDGSLRGDHFDMTPRRVVFEHVHKFGGYVTLLLASAALVFGLHLANAPRWMWLAIAAWWIALLSAAILAERRGMARDTYQAIWGPDPALPGARRKPIGLRIRRANQRPPIGM